jgi:hypothetical protein
VRLHGFGNSAPSEDANASTASAFARLMGTTPEVVGARIAHEGDSSAAQMFDPPADDAHEQRQDVLREDFTEGLGSLDGARPVGTGIDARIAASMDSTPYQATGQALETAMGAGPPRTGAGDAEPLRFLGVDQLPLTLAEQAGTTVVRNDNALNSAVVDAKVAHSPTLVEVTGPSAHAAVAPGAVTAIGAQQPQSIARQTAQLLASPRAVDSEQARAVTTNAPVDSHSATTARKSDENVRPGQRGTANSPAQSCGKAESSERSQFEQHVRSNRLNMGARRSTARLRLHPPELGRIRVDVRIAGDKVRIGVQTETDQARELLSGRASNLKIALQQHGILVDRFDVVTNTADQAAGDPAQERGFGATADAEGNQDQHGASATAGELAREREDERDAIASTIGESPLTAAGDTRLDIRI